jgi:diguanylate cyclase (GGDEF)-like protein/PAS domain S-box-containing protein
MLLLAGLVSLALRRVSEQQQRHESLNQTFATVAALEHSQSDLALLLASASTLTQTPDPQTADAARQAAGALEEHLGEARASALAQDDTGLLADLDNLIAQIGMVSQITQQRLPDLIGADGSQSTESAAAIVGELSRQASAIHAGLDRLVRQQQEDYAAAASAANHTADLNLWLLVGTMAAVAAAGCATVAGLLLPVLRPLASLQASVRAIASGDLGTRARVSGPEEVASLARDFNQMVTERQRADAMLRQTAMDLEDSIEALHESEERLGAVVANVPVILFVVNRDGVFTLCEGKGLEALGAKPEKVVGLSIFDVFRDQPDIKEKLHRALDSESFTTTAELDGVTFETQCAPLRDRGGQISGLIGVATVVTERKRMEEALRESEAKYRQIFENVQDIFYRTDLRGTILDLSPSMERYGYSRKALLGTSVLKLYENPERRSELVQTLLERGEVTDYEIRLKTAGGGAIDMSLSGRLLRSPDGTPIGVEGFLRDITERKRMEEAVRESEEKFRRIFDNVYDIYYRTDAQGIITDISPSVRQFGYTTEELIGRQVLDIYENPEERSALLEAILERGVVIDYEVRLKSGDGAARVTSVSSHLLRGPDGEFAGVEGSLRDITERKQMEEALRESEAKHRDLVENINELIYSLDENGQITYVSPVVEQLGGYTQSEVIGHSFIEFVHPDDLPNLIESYQRTVSGNLEPSEYRVMTKSGEIRWVRTSSRPVYDGDRIIGLRAVLMDITDHKQAAQALARQSALVEAMNRVFQEALTSESEEAVARAGLAVAEQLTGSKFGFIGVVDRTGRFDTLALSDPGWQACKIPSSDAVKAIRDMEIRGIWGSVIREGRPLIVNDPTSHPDRVGTPDGHPPITAFLGSPLRRGGKTIGMIAVANKESGYDLADQEDLESLSAAFVEALERRQAEQALRESEEKFRRIFDNVYDIYYRTDAQGIITDISPSVRQFGYTPEELIGRQVLDIYENPEERSALLQALFESGVVVDYEVHLKKGDGRVSTASVSTHLLRGPDGAFAGVEGSLRDITERKRMEKALRESEERYRSLVETSPDAIILADLGANIIMANRQAALLLGFESVEEMFLTGKTALDFIAPEERERGMRSLQETLQSGTVRDVEHTLTRKDRSRFPAEMSASLISDAEGNPKAFIGVVRDITERKRAEEALREQVRRDPLTGTLNHAAIVEELRCLISSGPEGAPHAVAMIDVNDLKLINDTFGHQVGDEVLVTVADALAGDGVLVGRYGGDEFVAILPGADREAAESYRQNVLASLGNVDLQDPDTGARVPVAVSVGFAIYPAEAERIEDLIKLADSAMYAWRRQRPVLSTVRSLSRSLGSDRAAKMVGEIVPLLTSSGDLNDKLRLVAHRLSVGAGYDGVNFALIRPGIEEPLSLNTFAEMPEQTIEAWNREQHENGWNKDSMRVLAERGRPMILDDLQGDQRLTDKQRELLHATGMQSAIVAPMLWRNELVGVLSVASKRKAAFGPRDAQFLMAVAAQVTGIVRMATLVGELQSTSTRLAQAQTETVMMLAAAAEAHDHATGLHLQNVRAITETLACELGYREEDAEELALAAVLHDIGKIRVPDVVLSTAGQLTDPEWELMKQHTVWGADFLAGRQGFELAATIARSHHERWDGSGYPNGLAGEDIPEAATIVAVADAFDAMTSDRPYRAARSVAASVREIVACSGSQFSPKVVQALVRLHKRKKLRLRRQTLGKLAA